MADAPEVKVKFSAEDTGVAAAIKQLVSQLQELKAKQQEVQASSISLKGALDAIASSAVVIKVVQFAKEVFNSAVQVAKLSQETGLSARTLSVYGKAADDAGVSQEAVDKGLVKLARSVVNFQQGGAGAAKAFADLGIKAEEFKGKSPDEKLQLVVDRLAKLGPGFRQSADTQALFGRGSAQLQLVLDKLAGDGFDKTAAAADKFGLLLDEKTASSFLSAAHSLHEVEDVAKGVALQFLSGLAPSVEQAADAFTDASVKGQGFKEVGEDIGAVLRVLAAILISLGEVVGDAIALQVEEFTGLFDVLKTNATGIFNALNDARKGNLAAAFQDLKTTGRDTVRELADNAQRQKAIFAQLGADLKKTWADALAPPKIATPARGDKPRGDDDAAPHSDADKLARAELSALKQAGADALAELKAQDAQQIAEEKDRFEKGLDSIRDFYAKRRSIQQGETQAEIDALKKERAAIAALPVSTGPEEISRKAELAHLDSEITQKQIEQKTQLANIDREESAAEFANKQKLAGFEEKVAQLQGQRHAEAIAAIAKESADLEKSLRAAGVAEDQIVAKVKEFRDAEIQNADFEETRLEFQEQAADLQEREADIQAKAAAGLISQEQAQHEIKQLEIDRLPVLERLAALMAAQAQSAQQATDATRAQATVDKTRGAAGQPDPTTLVGNLRIAGKELRGSITSDFANFFGSGINRAKSFGDAMRTLGLSVVQSLQRIAAQMLVNIAVQKIMKLLGLDTDDTEKRRKDAEAAVGSDAAKASADVFAQAIAQIPFPANLGAAPALALLVSGQVQALGIQGAAGLSEGGLIPGTGDSDTVPAFLTPGEFVVTKRAVAQIGPDHLERINRGLQRTEIAGLSSVPSASLVAALAAAGSPGEGRGHGIRDLHYSPTINHPTAPAADAGEFARITGRRLGMKL